MKRHKTVAFQYKLSEGSDFEGHRFITRDFWGHNRWDITYANVFQDESGEYWAYVYQVGATEYQDSGYEDPDEGTGVELVNVRPSIPTFKPDWE